MKEAMSNIDIRALLFELAELKGGKIEKIYHNPPDEIRIRIYSGEKKDLIVQPGRRIHLTSYPRSSPRFPSSFAMLLRKYLSGGRIEEIKQFDFDRIVEISVLRGEERYNLIAEIMTKGNLVLTDPDGKIIMPLRISETSKRVLKPGEMYEYPPSKIDPSRMSFDDLMEILSGEEEVVRTLARNLSIGGLYAEEICLRAGVNKKKKCSELTGEEVHRIYSAVREIFDSIQPGRMTPHIVYVDEKMIDCVPIDLKVYDGLKRRNFENFNSALDEFFSREAVEKLEEWEKEEESKKIKKLLFRLGKQKQALQSYEEKEKIYKSKGEAIYLHYRFLESIYNALKKARESRSWQEIEKIIENERKKGNRILKAIISVNPEKNSVDVKLDDLAVTLSLDRTLHQIAEEYFDLSKKFREKKEGVKRAMRITEQEIEKARKEESEKVPSPKIRIRRKVEWFERFRWFVSSEGFLVIGGRNAGMNEELVSKYMEKNDLFFHTQYPGGPVVIVKTEGREVGDKTIFEAGQFAVSYSSLWKEGVYEGECYYVNPSQVSKSPKSGEYLPRGSFYIRGKRNYLSVPVGVSVGVELDKQRVIGGPPSAVRVHADYYVDLTIGSRSHNELSKMISRMLYEMAREEDRLAVKAICTPDEVSRFLPPGKSDVVKQ